jgi:hypothetical protein
VKRSAKSLILSTPAEVPQPYVNVRVTDRQGRTQMRNIPVLIVLDLVMVGGGTTPGVRLDDREGFLTNFEAEVIEYGANEGPPNMEGGTGGEPRVVEANWEDEDELGAEPGEDYCRHLEYAYKGTADALEWVDTEMARALEEERELRWPAWVLPTWRTEPNA